MSLIQDERSLSSIWLEASSTIIVNFSGPVAVKSKPREIEAVFCAINHGTYKDRPICARNVNEIIKKTVVKVKGCERPRDGDVSGHSLRVGAAQDLLIRGYDLAAIMRAGGWSDASTVSRDLRFSHHNIWK